ncbi:NUDIX hydrolase domain-like protein [Aspergillus coremiiformis]|uniref:NUDIX hydrolase domain-like protein n=1 Tax=Aspergillus coremiiformis TaxID=138285 RepID=A0A5N6ZD98_9EURO|nr:NUDIX hydrolase domain-like protein [Aspergillus coremiiformis]
MDTYGNSLDAKGRPIVRTGVNAFVFRPDGTFLMGIRKGSHGAGTWGLPGGHLEFGESLEECVHRELKEETDLEVSNVQFFTVTNDFFTNEKKHYTTNFFTAKVMDSEKEAQIMEPNKCDEWAWFTWEEVMDYYREGEDKENKFKEGPLFLPTASLILQREELHPLGFHLMKSVPKTKFVKE